MHSLSRLTFTLIVLTTSASIAQAQNAEPRGLKGQGSAVQSMTGSGPSGKPSDPVAQPATFGGSTGGSGVATFPTASGNAGTGPQSTKTGTTPADPNRPNVAAEKKGFQDAVQNLHQDRRAVEADRDQLQADRRSGNKEALAADKQKLQADRKATHEARQTAMKERQELHQAREKAHEEHAAGRDHRGDGHQPIWRDKQGGGGSGANPQSQAQRPGPQQGNGGQANGKPPFANGQNTHGGPQQGNHPAPMTGGSGHRGRA